MPCLQACHGGLFTIFLSESREAHVPQRDEDESVKETSLPAETGEKSCIEKVGESKVMRALMGA